MMLIRHAALAVALTLVAAAPATQAEDAGAAELPAIELSQCARFTQEREMADLDTTLKSTGYFLRRDDALIWQTTRPVDDRVRLAADNPELPGAMKAMLPVLIGLLDGNWEALQEHFAVKRPDAERDTPNAWQARLVPLDDAVAERLERIDAAGGERVETLKIRFANADRITLRMTPVDCATLAAETETP